MGQATREMKMSEAAFQKRITDLCDWLGLRWHHEVDSRKSKSGFPDLVIVAPARVIFAELKTEKGRLTAEQEAWVQSLNRAGVLAFVWRPQDWESIKNLLTRLAKASL